VCGAKQRSRQSGPGSKPRKDQVYEIFSVPFLKIIKGATINGVTYEGVAEFVYLGTLISNDNSIEKEIQRHILAGNRTYFAAISLQESTSFQRY